ncbi:hypothetical protein SynBIOSU31_01715 [Synechococcus sp. BIOS-U3-1]|nr:hypothetical protein SynBIOSU31_01715 [Synechococcus sp. BIOS-U3-1]
MKDGGFGWQPSYSAVFGRFKRSEQTVGSTCSIPAMFHYLLSAQRGHL